MARLAVLVAGLALACLSPAVAAEAADAMPEYPLTIEKNRFQPEELRVKAGTPFIIVVTNKDATPEELESKALRIEKVVPGGKTLRVRVRALKPGAYPFVGEYHEATAKGRIVAE